MVTMVTNIQFKCQGSFTLWLGDMAKYTEDTKKNTDLHQQMPAQIPTPEVDRQGRQATTHRKRNEEETLDVDRMAIDRKQWRSLVDGLAMLPASEKA